MSSLISSGCSLAQSVLLFMVVIVTLKINENRVGGSSHNHVVMAKKTALGLAIVVGVSLVAAIFLGIFMKKHGLNTQRIMPILLFFGLCSIAATILSLMTSINMYKVNIADVEESSRNQVILARNSSIGFLITAVICFAFSIGYISGQVSLAKSFHNNDIYDNDSLRYEM